MSCAQYEDLILEYCEDALGAEERSRLEAHLCGCAECRAFFETQRELERSLSRAIGKPAPSPWFRQSVMQRIEAGQPRLAWIPFALDAAGYSSLAAIGGAVLSMMAPAGYANWALVAAYAAGGMWLGLHALRTGRLPGQR